MQTPDLKAKKVAVVGLGMTGRSCVAFLHKQEALITGFDTRSHLALELPIDIKLGDIPQSAFLDFDLVLVSPGFNLHHNAITTAKKAGVEVIGDVELFSRFNRKPVLAVTGSNGKSTVVTLLAHILNANGVKAVLGGNIGVPILSILDADCEAVVLELSSFQLESTYSLNALAACVLNLSQDHLDRHLSLEAYRDAKLRIYDHAQKSIANAQQQDTWPKVRIADAFISLNATQSGFGVAQEPLAITEDGQVYMLASDINLVGVHNLANVQAAVLLARELGLNDDAIRAAILDFEGLPHRCQTVLNRHNVRWINDSKATNVGATIAAIEGIKPSTVGKLVLVAGGDSKGADLNELADVFDSSVDHLIAMGKDAAKLAEQIPNANIVNSMNEAVLLAASLTQNGDTVLLSPACASLDMFSSFEDRGNQFTQAARALS